jgi:hypothetical protein
MECERPDKDCKRTAVALVEVAGEATALCATCIREGEYPVSEDNLFPEVQAQMEEWWAGLSEAEQIRFAIQSQEDNAGFWQGDDQPSYVAEKPWKFKTEAYLTHLSTQEADG